MFKAIQNGNLVALKKAVFRGGDVNTQDKNGDTLLIKAIKQNQIECFEYLLHNGAGLYITNQHGHSAMDYIMEWRKYEYLLLVVQAGYRVTAENDQLMHQITRGEEFLSTGSGADKEVIAVLQRSYCRLATELSYQFGPKVIVFQKNAIILDLLASIVVTLHWPDQYPVVAITAVSPSHPEPLNGKVQKQDWYEMVIDKNVVAIQAGLLIPYDLADLFELINNLHDEVLELYIDITR